MAKNKTLDEAIEQEIENTETFPKKNKLKRPFYRVKDIDGEVYDFETLEDVAESLEFNKGFIKKLINQGKTFLGVKIYIVK